MSATPWAALFRPALLLGVSPLLIFETLGFCIQLLTQEDSYAAAVSIAASKAKLPSLLSHESVNHHLLTRHYVKKNNVGVKKLELRKTSTFLRVNFYISTC